jgi:hypothetical protein
MFLSTSSGLIIEKDRIINRMNYYAEGEIGFHEIRELEILTVRKQVVLAIILKDPDRLFLERSVFSRILMKKSMKRFGSPFIIQDGSVDVSLQELHRLVSNKMASQGRMD